MKYIAIYIDFDKQDTSAKIKTIIYTILALYRQEIIIIAVISQYFDNFLGLVWCNV